MWAELHGSRVAGASAAINTTRTSALFLFASGRPERRVGDAERENIYQ